MATETTPSIETAEVVLPCGNLDDMLTFFMDRLGFRISTIFPADDPAIAVLSGHGLTVRIERGATGTPGTLRLNCSDPAALGGGAESLTAPNGTIIELVDANPPLDIPPVSQSFVVTRLSEGSEWSAGRAGMGYRDLIPEREGGRFIASHIRIPGGGPVPDYVHFHKVRFQMIYCYKGWVRVAYEDQGEPMVLRAGDCFLQPPEIRHRVLESSEGLEVIELGCPADHITGVDHDMTLPTGRTLPDRDFGGQRFVFHQAEKADWQPWRLAGFEARDLGIGAATNGLAGVKVARVSGTPQGEESVHDVEFLFHFVLEGALTLAARGNAPQALKAGDCFAMPAGMSYTFNDCSSDLELLEVALPAAF